MLDVAEDSPAERERLMLLASDEPTRSAPRALTVAAAGYARQRVGRRTALIVLIVALLTSCGRSEDSPEDKARSTIETMLAGLREADGGRVCESLTALAAITLAEEDCARAISHAAAEGKAAMRALGDDKIRAVDLEHGGAAVKTTGATWYLEEVDGDYFVNDASAIGEAAARDPQRAVR